MTTPQYNAPYPGATDSPKGRGPAIAALILGSVGILLSFTFCLSWLGILLGVIGIILGIVAFVSISKDPAGKKGMAIGGIIASIIAILIGVVVYIAAFTFGGQAARWAIVEGTKVEADAMAADARARGVNEEIIAAARAELDAVLDAGTSDLEDMESFAEEVERAKEDYEQTLEDAAAGGAEDEAPPMDEPGEEDAGGGE